MNARAARTLRTDGPALFALAFGAVATAVVANAGIDFDFGVDNRDLDLTLVTIDGCMALAVVGFLVARRRRTGRRQDQLLTDAVAILAFGLVLGVFAVLGDRAVDADVLWTRVLLRTYAAGLVLAAAVAGDRPAGPRDSRWTVARRAGIVITALAPFLLHWWGLSLPAPIPDTPADPSGPSFRAHPVVIALHAFAAAAVFLAALLFSRQARRVDDAFVRWLAAAMVLFGVSRLHYALYPSLYPGWVYTGDVLRTSGYFLLLVGAVLEVRDHYADQTRTAIEQERRRLARELHDGLAQELTLIRVSAQPLVGAVDDPGPAEIIAATDRAEAEVRSAIDALTLDVRAELGREVLRVARDVATTRGLGVRIVRLDEGVVEPGTRHEVLRIVREAVNNAARHAGATAIELSLAREGEAWRLSITDDGAGFEPASASGGHGLTSMRERARSLAGTLTISSPEGLGTTVEVAW